MKRRRVGVSKTAYSVLVDKYPRKTLQPWSGMRSGRFLLFGITSLPLVESTILLNDLDPLPLKFQNMVLNVVFDMGRTIMDGGFRSCDDVVWLLVKASKFFGSTVVSVIR